MARRQSLTLEKAQSKRSRQSLSGSISSRGMMAKLAFHLSQLSHESAFAARRIAFVNDAAVGQFVQVADSDLSRSTRLVEIAICDGCTRIFDQGARAIAVMAVVKPSLLVLPYALYR